MLYPGVVLAHQPFLFRFDAPAPETFRSSPTEVLFREHPGEELEVDVVFAVDEGVFQRFLLLKGFRHGFDGPWVADSTGSGGTTTGFSGGVWYIDTPGGEKGVVPVCVPLKRAFRAGSISGWLVHPLSVNRHPSAAISSSVTQRRSSLG